MSDENSIVSNAIPVEKSYATTLNASSHAAFRGVFLVISIMMGVISISIGACDNSPTYPYSLGFLIVGYLMPSVYLVIEIFIYFKIKRMSYEDHVRDQERTRLTHNNYLRTYEDRLCAGVREDAGFSAYNGYQRAVSPLTYQECVRRQDE